MVELLELLTWWRVTSLAEFYGSRRARFSLSKYFGPISGLHTTFL